MLKLALLLMLLAGNVYAQWIPVVARVKETTEVLVGENRVKIEVREGFYYRRSDGTVLHEWTAVDGDAGRGSGVIVKAGSTVTYQLSLASRTAFERKSNRRAPAAPTYVTTKRSKGETVIGGVGCYVLPLKTQTPEQKAAGLAPVEAGEVCWSNQLSLMVKRDQTYFHSDKRVRTTYEMADIRIHEEPDPKLFDLVGRGFTVYAKSPTGPSPQE